MKILLTLSLQVWRRRAIPHCLRTRRAILTCCAVVRNARSSTCRYISGANGSQPFTAPPLITMICGSTRLIKFRETNPEIHSVF